MGDMQRKTSSCLRGLGIQDSGFNAVLVGKTGAVGGVDLGESDF